MNFKTKQAGVNMSPIFHSDRVAFENSAPENDCRILLYGDSISKGVVYDEQKQKYVVIAENYAALVQNRLKGIIHNAARFGNTIIKAVQRFPAELQETKPDVVVIEFGGNDCDYNWEEIAANPGGKHLPKTELETFRTGLVQLIDSLQRQAIVPVLLTLPPIDADRYFLWISKNNPVKQHNILEWLGSVTKIYWWQERYNSMIINIAEETRTRFIDIRGAFLQNPDYTQYICKDGIHPNEAGHRIIADRILGYIRINYDFILKEPDWKYVGV